MEFTDLDTDFGQPFEFLEEDHFNNLFEEELHDGFTDEYFSINLLINDSPNNQNRPEFESNSDVLQSPPLSPLGDLSNVPSSQMAIHCEPKRTKKNYGDGPEHRKIKNKPHFGQPFKQCKLFKQLGRPKMPWFKQIGEMYNKQFKQEIASRQLPMFSRHNFRRKDLAYFFIEDHKDIIIPWLKNIGKIPDNF